MTWIGKNVVSVGLDGLDNTNTNMGSRNSLWTRILAKNPQTFIPEYNCHLTHLAAGKGGEAYASVAKSDCENHQVGKVFFKNIWILLVVNGKTLRDSFQLSGYLYRSVGIKN